MKIYFDTYEEQILTNLKEGNSGLYIDDDNKRKLIMFYDNDINKSPSTHDLYYMVTNVS